MGDDATLVDHHDVVGELIGFFEVLRGEQHSGALRHQPLDDTPQTQSRTRIEPGRRFIKEQDGGLCDEACREVEPTTHATGVGAHWSIGSGSEVKPLEQLDRALAHVRRLEVVKLAEHPQVLAAGEVLVDRRVLSGEADRASHFVGLLDDVKTGDRRGARCGLEQSRQDSDGRGLACAVGPEQADHLAARDDQVDSVEGYDLAELLDQS